MTDILISCFGFLVGGLIGAAFGAIQNAALFRHKNREAEGRRIGGAGHMVGSMRRVAFLMIALVLVQVGLPMLFDGVLRWMVSAGVMIGYGFMFFQKIRRRTDLPAAHSL